MRERTGTVKPVMWWTALLLLFAAAMLLADIGAAGVWIAVIAVGIALVAIATKHRPPTKAP